MAWQDSQQLDLYLPLMMKRLQQQPAVSAPGFRARWRWLVASMTLGTLLAGGWIAYTGHHALF